MFSDDLDTIFRGGDPEQMAERLEEWQRQFDKHIEGFDRLQQATSGLQVTEVAADGGVRVTVDVSGQVVDITTTEKLDDVASAEIGPLVLSCIRRAQGTLAARFAETAKETLGDDPVGERLAEQYQQRFPDADLPEPSPARAAAPDEEDGAAPIKWDEV